MSVDLLFSRTLRLGVEKIASLGGLPRRIGGHYLERKRLPVSQRSTCHVKHHALARRHERCTHRPISRTYYGRERLAGIHDFARFHHGTKDASRRSEHRHKRMLRKLRRMLAPKCCLSHNPSRRQESQDGANGVMRRLQIGQVGLVGIEGLRLGVP